MSLLKIMLLIDIAEVSQGLALVGRGAGAREGNWMLRVAEGGDIGGEGWLEIEDLKEVGVVQNLRTERHLLRPFDVLVTARTERTQVALVPPNVSRTVAGVTLLVARPRQPESGMGHWLYYFLASTYGQVQLAKRMAVNSTSMSLSAKSLGEVEVPMPSVPKLNLMARLIESSEAAYDAEVRTARLRRDVLRDAIVQDTLRAGEIS